MKRRFTLFISISFLLLFNLVMSSCSTDSATPTNKSRNVKFELTGNYTGKITVAYTLANGGTQAFSDIKLPWTKEVVYESTVGGLGFSGNGEISLSNVPGQTVTINIYSDNKVVKTGSASVDSNQILILPTLTFMFPL
jgi:hypothetical protein